MNKIDQQLIDSIQENNSSRLAIEQMFNTFVVRSFNGYFGKGKSIAEALKNCKCGKQTTIRVFWGTDDITCNDYGNISATNLLDLGYVQIGKDLKQ